MKTIVLPQFALAAIVLMFGLGPLRIAPCVGSENARSEMPYIRRGLTSAITSVAISPDGQRVITSGVDGCLTVWNCFSGLDVGSLNLGRQIAISGYYSDRLQFGSARSDCILAGSDEIGQAGFEFESGSLALQTKTGAVTWACTPTKRIKDSSLLLNKRWKQSCKALLDRFKQFADPDCIAANPSVDILAVSADSQICVLSPSLCKRKWTFDTLGTKVTSLNLSPSGTHLVAGTACGEILVWRIDSEIPLARVTYESSPILSTCIDDKGGICVFGVEGGSVCSWQPLKSGADVIRLLSVGAAPLVAISANGKRGVAAGSNSMEAFVFDTFERMPAKKLVSDCDVPVVLEKDLLGMKVVVGNYASGTVIWNMHQARPLSSLPIECVTDVSLSGDGKVIATSDSTAFKSLACDCPSGLAIFERRMPLSLVGPVSLNGDGSRLLLANSMSNGVDLVDLANGKHFLECKNNSGYPVRFLDLSKDADMLIYAYKGTVDVWDTRRRSLVNRIAAPDLTYGSVVACWIEHSSSEIWIVYCSGVALCHNLYQGKTVSFKLVSDEDRDTIEWCTPARDLNYCLVKRKYCRGAQVWDLKRRRPVIPMDPEIRFGGLAVNSNKNRMLTIGSQCLVIWDLEKRAPAGYLYTFSSAKAWIVISIDGKYDGSEGVVNRFVENCLEFENGRIAFPVSRLVRVSGLLKQLWQGNDSGIL
jgi:WD40 repeat protein